MKSLAESIKNVFVGEEQRFKKELGKCSTNRDRVALIRKNYPDAKAIRIAEELGISRERVRQLLTKLNLPTSWETEPFPTCAQCGIQFTYRPGEKSSGLCKDCFMASKRSIIICFQCRKSFLLRTKDYTYRIRVRKYEHTFCSKQCWGAYAGRTYGFSAHPENIRLGWETKNAN